MSETKFQMIAKRILNIECNKLLKLKEYINKDFERVCNLIINSIGRVVLMGVGKSGHIARKIASTLASTGTPSFFVHPVEASHGDLGMITHNDIVLAISNSGESSEIISLLPVFKRQNIFFICMTNNKNSTMAKIANIHLYVKVSSSKGLLGLIPTTSAVAMLIMGDTIALSLLEVRGFTINDFAVRHPGGMIGRKLLLQVSDLMYTGEDIPIVNTDASLQDVLIEISKKNLGIVVICNNKKQIKGVFANNDLHKIFLMKNINWNNIKIIDLMTINYIKIQENMLAVDALDLMNKKHINTLIVAQSNILLGILHIHSLLQAGIC